MIKYRLLCEEGHKFEGWFSHSTDYDDQKEKGILSCPICDSFNVAKDIMAPSVVRSGTPSTSSVAAAYMEFAEAIQKYISENFVDVGDKFASEVRKSDPDRPQALRGQASLEEAMELIEEGYPVFPVPSTTKGLN